MNTSHLSRRGFLRGAAGAALTGIATLSSSAVEPFVRRGTPRLLIALSGYSLRNYFNHAEPSRRISLFDFVDYCADLGIQGAEVTSYYFPKDLTDAYLLKLKHHAFLRGVELSGTAVGNNFARPDGPELDREIAEVKRWIDHAALMGAPHIRVFAGAPKGIAVEPAKRQCIRALEECGEYAGRKGVWLGLENHGGIVAKVADLLEIVRAVESPWVGVNLDSGNFNAEDPYEGMARLAPYAVNVQVKVEARFPDGTREPVDLKRLRRILRNVNYQGYVALEYEAKEDPWSAIPPWIERMSEALAD